ncbi:MAG: hypothetical protein LBB84_03500 [Tannerellaceae bacterium]|jgi:hypothetical protein|nr:hypothetical protein [Tannerellaceae bacterium]
MNATTYNLYREHAWPTFRCGNIGQADAVELKCLLVSKGVRVDGEIYERFGNTYRINPSPSTCNSMKLSDGTNVQLTDWPSSPFRLKVSDGKPALFCEEEFVCYVTFHPYSDFYSQKTSSGLPFIGNAVLQGCDFVSFPYLWHCEYAAAGKPCQFCFNKPQSPAVPYSDVAEIVRYATLHDKVNSVQLTGGSTFSGQNEHRHIVSYLNAIANSGADLTGEILLYITPPTHLAYIDEYFSLGASRIACSIEVWDREKAQIITPGKSQYATRERHLNALTYIAETYGNNKAFCNFVIGLESVETLKEGATWLARRGIIPSASVWMPMGRAVMGSLETPDVTYFRRVKEMLSDLYIRYNLSPAGGCGLNVCIEKDISMARI